MDITLTEFVDFSLETGTAQVNLVRQAKERAAHGYDVRTDWYKQLREEIIDLHKAGTMSPPSLDAWLSAQTNAKKMPTYTSRISGYKDFIDGKSLTWFAAPRGRWVDGDLEVKVNPELGLVIDGQRTVVKLYLKGKAPTVNRSEAIFGLLEEELRSKVAATTRFAILDVAGGKLILPNPKWSASDMRALLRAEAAAFRSLWDAV